MPLVREDPTENSGVVVGTVSSASRIVVDREREVDINVAPASPRNQSPAPRPRFGGSGVVVVDEERDMGMIAFSSNAQAPIRLADSAQVASSASSDMVRMGAVEVGRRKTAAEQAPSSGIDGGVTVGRLLSPTVSRTVVTASSASDQAIERTEQGHPVRIEKFASRSTGATATGDVQEARFGDELEDLLPDAVSPPEVYRPEAEDPAFAAVRMMVPDFAWNRDRPVKEKVAEALKHVKNPLYVKGILAVESNLVREEIKAALSNLLQNPGALEK